MRLLIVLQAPSSTVSAIRGMRMSVFMLPPTPDGREMFHREIAADRALIGTPWRRWRSKAPAELSPEIYSRKKAQRRKKKNNLEGRNCSLFVFSVFCVSAPFCG